MGGKIEFISTVEGLDEIEECRPKPAKYFVPKWFKDMPAFSGEIPTVRHCPSFPDFFSLGYILPMWTDCKLRYDKDSDRWSWDVSSQEFLFTTHDSRQFLNHTKTSFNGVEGQLVFKANCPWRVNTPPGWSVLQLPLFYHFNQEWSVLPGIIDTDIHSEINQQILYHGNDKKEVRINRGDPLVLYVPYKRKDTLDLNIRAANKKDQKRIARQNLNISTKYVTGGVYRQLQRQRDKNK